MIYIFAGLNNEVSVVYDGSTITEEQKQQAMQVEALPIKPQAEPNHTVVLKADGNTVWYEQVINPREIILEQELSDAIDLLIEGGIL